MDINTIEINDIVYNLIDKDFYDMISDEYDNTKTYEVNDYCIYEYGLYRCIAAVTMPEDFDNNKWVVTNLAEFVRGGSS